MFKIVIQYNRAIKISHYIISYKTVTHSQDAGMWLNHWENLQAGRDDPFLDASVCPQVEQDGGIAG